jgi:hypothetical protein
MNKIVQFIKSAAPLGYDANQIAAMLKHATGQDIDPSAVQSVLGNAGGGAAPSPGDAQGASQVPGGAPSGPDVGAAQMMQALSQGGAGGSPGGDPSSLAQSMGGGMPVDPAMVAQIHQGHPHLPEHEIAQIAMEIEQFLQQQDAAGAGGDPGADAGAPPDLGAGAPPDAGAGAPPAPHHGHHPKQASAAQRGLAMVKKAKYIEGAITTLMMKGASIPEAVDFYGEALARTIAYTKQAEELEKLSQHIDPKTAEYCEGIVETAKSRNLNFDQTVALLKDAGIYDRLLHDMTASISTK